MKKKPARRSFTREFKLEAVRQIVEQNRSIAEVSRDLGVGAGQLGQWKQQFLADREEAFRGKGRIDRHRMINQTLAQEFAGGVHALAIHASAPGEGGG